MNVSIEDQINSEFVKQISELPEESSDPVENTLEYIKNRACCSDYEAAQIQTLMSEQSGQKQGYKYFCRYIAGQSTPEEDNADYYKSIRKSWNRFLDNFSRMSLDERVEAFTVYSGSEKALKILENSEGDKLDFITKKTEVKLGALESKASELKSKSKTFLVSHLGYTLDSAREIEKRSDEYFASVIRSEIEYNIVQSNVNIDKLGQGSGETESKLVGTIKKMDSNLVLAEGVVNSPTNNNNIKQSDRSPADSSKNSASNTEKKEKKEVVVAEEGVDIGSAVVEIIAGTVSLVLGVIMFKAAMGTSAITAGLVSAATPAAVGLILTGLTGILHGIQKLLKNINTLTKI